MHAPHCVAALKHSCKRAPPIVSEGAHSTCSAINKQTLTTVRGGDV